VVFAELSPNLKDQFICTFTAFGLGFESPLAEATKCDDRTVRFDVGKAEVSF
jgi:hypothetical protein